MTCTWDCLCTIHSSSYLFDYTMVFQVLNIVTLILYRVGFQGNLLGIGGTWNLNDDKSADAEIVASGVFVGYFIYTVIQLVSDCFRPEESKRYVLREI